MKAKVKKVIHPSKEGNHGTPIRTRRCVQCPFEWTVGRKPTLTFAKALTHPCRSIWVHPLVVFSFDTTLLAYLKAKIRRIRRMAFAQNLSRLIGASPTVNHTRLHRCTRLPEPNRRPLPVPLAMGHRCARILGSAFDH
jgi:hypothetical protein